MAVYEFDFHYKITEKQLKIATQNEKKKANHVR